MFREMRRAGQALDMEAVQAMLSQAGTGIFGVIGDGGYPYTVPVNFAYEDGKIYFHGSMTGHKVDAVKADSRVSFCVVGADDVIAEDFTTAYQSVIAFGRARIVDEPKEKRRSFDLIIQKYCPDFVEEAEKPIREGFDSTCVICVDIEHITGKQGKKLVEA